jgi:sec-independent protein translocase protein TatB
VFGFSFGELVVLVIVAVVVIGPKDMPKVLRKLGQGAGKLRRMASDIRRQSGIDDVLRGEGIADDINEIRKLARGEMEGVTRAVRVGPTPSAPTTLAKAAAALNEEIVVQRDREYPTEGADAYRALPDTALVYAGTLPLSSLARDALYITGDPDGVVPEPAAAPTPPTDAPPAEPESAPHDA